MNDSTQYEYIPYHIAIAGRVQEALRELLLIARSEGRQRRFLQGLDQLSALLRVYPQHGEPLRDLYTPPATIRILTIPPVVVRFTLYEEPRLVSINTPFALL